MKGVQRETSCKKFPFGVPLASPLNPNLNIRLNVSRSRYHGDPLIIKCENVEVLSEGDRIELFDAISLDVFETPGHNKSCLTFKVGNSIFTGDAYIPGIKVVTTLPNANKMDAEASKERIAAMVQGLDLYPGHGNVYLNYICNS